MIYLAGALLNPVLPVQQENERQDRTITQNVINFVKGVFRVILIFTLATIAGTFYGLYITARKDIFIDDTPEQAKARLFSSLIIGVVCGVMATGIYLNIGGQR